MFQRQLIRLRHAEARLDQDAIDAAAHQHVVGGAGLRRGADHGRHDVDLLGAASDLDLVQKRHLEWIGHV
jgi:hypothetical protein